MELNVYLQTEKLGLAKLQGGTYKDANREYTVPSWHSSLTVVDITEPLFFQEKKYNIFYQNGDVQISSPAFHQLVHDLKKAHGEFDDDGDEFEFYSRADREAYEAEVSKWKQDETIEYIWIPVTFKIAGQMPVNNEDYLTPIQKINGSAVETLYQYDKQAHIIGTLIEALAEKGWGVYTKATEKEIKAPAILVNGEFSKVYFGSEERYLSSLGIAEYHNLFLTSNSAIPNSLDHLRKLKAKTQKDLESFVLIVLGLNKKVSPETIYEIRSELTKVLSAIKKIDVKQASKSEWTWAVKVTHELINKL